MYWIDGEKWSRKNCFKIPQLPSELLLPSAKKSAQKGWIGRYLWRGSWNFKTIFSRPLFTIIFKPKMVSTLRKNFLYIVWHQKPTAPRNISTYFFVNNFANQVTCQLSSFIEKIYSVCKSKIEGGQPRNQWGISDYCLFPLFWPEFRFLTACMGFFRMTHLGNEILSQKISKNIFEFLYYFFGKTFPAYY